MNAIYRHPRALLAGSSLLLAACVPARSTVSPRIARDSTTIIVGATSAMSFVREELYFGVNRRAGGVVTDAEWTRFLEDVVTPKFPECLTVLQGQGQYRLAGGDIVREGTRVIVVLYRDAAAEIAIKSAAIAEITRLYRERFDQESVLRVSARVRAAF